MIGMVEFETESDTETRTLQLHHSRHRAVLRMPANLHAALAKILQSIAVVPGLQFQARSRGETGEIDSLFARKLPALRRNTAGRTRGVRGVDGPADLPAGTAI